MPDTNFKPHTPISISKKLLDEEYQCKLSANLTQATAFEPNSGLFTSAVAIITMVDFQGFHTAHPCEIPVPLHDADVDYFKRMEPVTKAFYLRVASTVRAVRLLSVVLIVTLNDGTKSYHAIQHHR